MTPPASKRNGMVAAPQCIGYGRHEGNCQQLATATSARLWCPRCEALRRKTITAQMAKITASFGGPS